MREVRRSVCPLDCPDRCALDVTVEDNRILKIDGSKRSPLTDGYICAKVRAFDRRLDSPERILYPMRRKGRKGSGEFERIRWDEAITTIASRYHEIIKNDGPEAILPYSYSGSNGLLTSSSMDERFWHRLGATETTRTLCAANTTAAWAGVFEEMPGSDPAEITDSDAIVIWGMNPSASSIHLVPLVREARRRGAWLAVIDPRLIPLAKEADAHVALRPGTDVIVALAMANVAFQENLLDSAFLQKYARGLDSLQKAAAEWTPERAAEAAGIDASLITTIPRVIAKARAPFFRVGWGPERNRNGVDSIRAIVLLRCLFGRFNKKGAGLALSTSRGYRMALDNVEGTHLRAKPARTLNMSRLGEILEETRNPPVRALFIYNCNPVATVPNQNRVERALAREDLFTVCHEQVFTDSCAWADIVLPATTFLEHRELSRSYGGYALQYAEAVIPPRGEAISNHELFSRLARAMNYTEKEFKDSEIDVARQVAASPRDQKIQFEELREKAYIPIDARKPFVNVFPSRGWIDFAGAAPPRYRPVPADSARPLALISPATDKAISSTLYEQLDGARGVLMISPADAAARKLKTGDRARVFNSFGEVIIGVSVREEMREGVVSIPKGYWKRATHNGQTACALAPDHVDEIGGGACYNDARVDVEAANL